MLSEGQKNPSSKFFSNFSALKVFSHGLKMVSSERSELIMFTVLLGFFEVHWKACFDTKLSGPICFVSFARCLTAPPKGQSAPSIAQYGTKKVISGPIFRTWSRHTWSVRASWEHIPPDLTAYVNLRHQGSSVVAILRLKLLVLNPKLVNHQD